MSVRGFRDSFRSYTPAWLQNRQDSVTGKLLNVGYRMLYAVIFPLDVATQLIVEGLKAAFPGIGTPTALPILGLARSILQGEAESNAAFAARLIAWRQTWSQNDSFASEQLARQIQAYLGNTPAVNIVDRAGHWTMLSAGGVATETTSAWNWDGVSNPERAGIWSDLWIIIYPCEWAQAATLGSRGSPSTQEGYGIGHQVQRIAVDAILSLVALWKGAHTTVRAIIFSYDPTIGVPAGAANPDGTWGYWSKLTGGPTSTKVAARSPNARYWIHPEL